MNESTDDPADLINALHAYEQSSRDLKRAGERLTRAQEECYSAQEGYNILAATTSRDRATYAALVRKHAVSEVASADLPKRLEHLHLTFAERNRLSD